MQPKPSPNQRRKTEKGQAVILAEEIFRGGVVAGEVKQYHTGARLNRTKTGPISGEETSKLPPNWDPAFLTETYQKLTKPVVSPKKGASLKPNNTAWDHA